MFKGFGLTRRIVKGEQANIKLLEKQEQELEKVTQPMVDRQITNLFPAPYSNYQNGHLHSLAQLGGRGARRFSQYKLFESYPWILEIPWK